MICTKARLNTNEIHTLTKLKIFVDYHDLHWSPCVYLQADIFETSSDIGSKDLQLKLGFS